MVKKQKETIMRTNLRLHDALELIRDITEDYDEYGSKKNLRSLIDEIKEYATNAVTGKDVMKDYYLEMARTGVPVKPKDLLEYIKSFKKIAANTRKGKRARRSLQNTSVKNNLQHKHTDKIK